MRRIVNNRPVERIDTKIQCSGTQLYRTLAPVINEAAFDKEKWLEKGGTGFFGYLAEDEAIFQVIGLESDVPDEEEIGIWVHDHRHSLNGVVALPVVVNSIDHFASLQGVFPDASVDSVNFVLIEGVVQVTDAKGLKVQFRNQENRVVVPGTNETWKQDEKDQELHDFLLLCWQIYYYFFRDL